MNIEKMNLKYANAMSVLLKQPKNVKDVTQTIVAKSVKKVIGHGIKTSVNAYRNYNYIN